MTDFLQAIHKWYNQNLRDLPWRETSDPYKIWISEIILQQTRVAQGISYYHRFIERFPTVTDLAEAEEDEVLKLWQGLGYYSRARNLHAAAQTISGKYGGEFPKSYSEIRELKGIGPYTAAAIASIAFGLPYPALDGNVYRVLARYFGIFAPPNSGEGKKKFLKIAEEIIPAENPGFHNQAMMEFGALQCIPLSPDCPNCPLIASCYAAGHQKVTQLPVKTPKTSQRNRYFYYYYIETGKDTWLEKRTGKDIWENLYQFPLAETKQELSDEEIAGLQPSFMKNDTINIKAVSAQKKHILSHQIIFARLIHLETDGNFKLNNHFIKVPQKDIHTFAVPRLVEKLMEETGIF
ncbi:A/G-specific adenine glycosylase [Mariniphaga sediminis]|uniref:Adenine DNA glycosylase n=1 Tax=Mariniphaga sediminis TaxID=1628158 RepID=A0A399D010_9BACT|nr:A/G-specific adenine glycosylase [Mariniphaga sediminis]RIH64826.1 A/G-specific adenine glycosylase [Mariniphaga sediminis]